MYEQKQNDSHLTPFCLTARQKAGISLSEMPVSTAELVYRLNEAVDGRRMRLLKIAELEEAMMRGGYFVYEAQEDGKIAKTPSDKAKILGVSMDCKRLAGGGEVTLWRLCRPLQQDILLHINALLGQDAALDRDFAPAATPQKNGGVRRMPHEAQSPANGTAEDLSKKAENTPSHFRYCWNCEGKIPARFSFPCPSCGWPICPKCGACRSPRTGGCPESKKGLGRFTGLLKEKNDIRTQLLNSRLLSTAAFDELRQVESPDALRAFRQKYASLFEQLETIRAEKREQQAEEKAEKVKEAKLNQRGFFKIVSVSPRLVTYQTANGLKKTLPNQPPVRVGKEYVDLTGVPPAER